MPKAEDQARKTIEDFLPPYGEPPQRTMDILKHEMITPYHAKYLAYELTKRCASDSVEKLAAALSDA